MTAGGRVLEVVGPRPDLATARARAYDAVGHLRWPGCTSAPTSPTRRHPTTNMKYKVAILMGSPNDREKMQPAADMLERFGIEADVRVHSAHRTPAKVAELASTAREQGYCAFICGAGHGGAPGRGGGRAHDAAGGRRAALGRRAQRGGRALRHRADAQGHPGGDGRHRRRENAALLVVQMLAISDADLAAQLADHRVEIAGASDPERTGGLSRPSRSGGRRASQHRSG